jgi:O-antigen/teichoic acid export membrane protein
LFSRLAHGFLWTSAGNIAAQLLALLGGIVAARWLGKGQFGELSLIKSTVLMLGVFAGSGFGVTVAKYVSEHRSLDPQRCGGVIILVGKVAMGLGLVLAIVCIAFAPQLVLYAIGTDDLAMAFRIAAFLALLHILSAIQQGILVGLEAFRPLSFLIMIEATVTLAGTAIGASRGNLIECLVGISVAALLNVTLRGWVTRSHILASGIVVDWRDTSVDRSVLWKFALPSILLGLMVWPFEWLGRVFVARTPLGMEELGKFAVAYSWAALVLFLPTQLANPSLPVLSNLHGMRNGAGFVRIARIVLALALASGLLVAAVIAGSSNLILRFYGEAFVDARGTLLILLLAYAISSATVMGSIFAACGRMWWQLFHYGLWGLTLAVGAYLWRAYGAEGLGASYVAAYLVLVLCQIVFAYRLVGQAYPRDGAG